MKKFWIDFSGYVCVEAENAEQAENKMWDAIHRTLAFPTDFCDDVWDIDGVEEWADNQSLLETVYSEKDINIMKVLAAGHVPTAEEWEDFWNNN
jgi:hypothetical protein